MLAQRQNLRALQHFTLAAKAHKPASSAASSFGRLLPASDPRSTQRRTSGDAMTNAGRIFGSTVLLSTSTAA